MQAMLIPIQKIYSNHSTLLQLPGNDINHNR